jgi:hypothetical protein
VSGDTYRSFRVHVIPVTGGRLSLYSYLDHTGKPAFFIQRNDDAPVELESTVAVNEVDGTRMLQRRDEYKFLLARLTADCPKMMTSKMEVEYTETALRKKVFAYNHCGGDAAATAESSADSNRHNQSRWYFSPLIGFAHSSVHVSGSTSYEAEEQWSGVNTVTGGIGALYVLPRGRGQYSLVANVLFEHFHSTGSAFNGGRDRRPGQQQFRDVDWQCDVPHLRKSGLYA